MFRTASTSIARRRYKMPPSPSSSSSFVNHQSILYTNNNNNNVYQHSTILSPSNYSSTTSIHQQHHECYDLIHTQCMIRHQSIVWRSQHHQLRSLSTNSTNNRTGWAKTVGQDGKGESGSGGGDDDNLIFGLDRKRILIGLGIFSVGSAIIALPVATRYMEEVQHEYTEDEVEVDDELYQRMKDISAEVEGEITQRLLGEELSKKLIEGGKKKAVDNTVELFTDVINSEALQNAITTLLSNIVTSSQFKGACQMLLKNLWDDLIADPETTAQVVALLNTAIKDERIKSSFKELILGLLRDEEVKKELTSLVVQLGEEQEVLDATRELLTESAHRALNDPEILDHSMEFATDVVGDNVLQRTSGEALRNTVTYAVKPSLSTFLSVFGIALLFLSASALGKARISAREVREIDAAVSVVAKSIGNNFLSKLGKILSIPAQAVSGLTSAIVATLLFPFQMVGKAAGALSSAGSVAVYTVFDVFSKASSFPAFVREIASLSLSYMKLQLSNMTQQSGQWILSMSGAIASKTRIWISTTLVFMKDGLKYRGMQAYSSMASMLIATGMGLSNMLNSLIQKSLLNLNYAGNQALSRLSDAIARLVSKFRGTSTV